MTRYEYFRRFIQSQAWGVKFTEEEIKRAWDQLWAASPSIKKEAAEHD